MDKKEIEQLWTKYDTATKKLGPSGQPGEKEFATAYQQLVRRGLAMQIKKKFRGGR